MCYLYLLSKRKSPLENDDENAQTAVTHCEHAIDILNKLENTENNKKYREKALYRRAMAYHHICQESSAAPDRKNEVLNLAAQDLLDVLNINSKNSAAAKLLSSIRKLHSQNKSMGPLQKCLDVFKGYLRGDAEHTSDEVKGALRTIITGEFLDDFGRSGGRDIILGKHALTSSFQLVSNSSALYIKSPRDPLNCKHVYLFQSSYGIYQMVTMNYRSWHCI